MNTENDDSFVDGRKLYDFDKSIENQIQRHSNKYQMDSNEILRNFPIYIRRVHLKRFLAHYELFTKTINLPGDIIELGVFRGTTLMSWANFLEIRNMGDRHKKVIGFDNFMGFGAFDKKDGAISEEVDKVDGGFSSAAFLPQLEDAISIYDQDRFIPHKKRINSNFIQNVKKKNSIDIILNSLNKLKCKTQRPIKMNFYITFIKRN